MGTPPALGDDVVGFHRRGGMLAQPSCAMGAEGFLVGDRRQDQCATGTEAAPGEAPESDGHGGGDVQHVDGAPAPDLPVDELAAERVAAPGVRVHRHDVGVAEVAERRRAGVASFDPRHERGAAGERLIALKVAA